MSATHEMRAREKSRGRFLTRARCDLQILIVRYSSITYKLQVRAAATRQDMSRGVTIYQIRGYICVIENTDEQRAHANSEQERVEK